jgi:hypothetical protein
MVVRITTDREFMAFGFETSRVQASGLGTIVKLTKVHIVLLVCALSLVPSWWYLQSTLDSTQLALQDFGFEAPINEHVRHAPTSAPADSGNNLMENSNQIPACTVFIENLKDYHYEVIESTILKYPLPWNKLDCDTSNPVVFDVGLVLNGQHKFSGELEGWMQYFHTQLQGKVVNRLDGVQVRFGSIFDFQTYAKVPAARIGVSCDSNIMQFKRWLRANPNRFCVLHGTCPTCSEKMLKEQTCHLNPMHPNCFFMPSVFPQFEQQALNNNARNINACVSGTNRHHSMLVEALAILQPQGLKISILGRQRGTEKMYSQHNVSHYVQVVHEIDFYLFQKHIAQCDLLMPLVDPELNPGFFAGVTSMKKLTGSIAQAIGYKIPTVMHEELQRIYHDQLTAPVEVYNDTSSFIAALDRMLMAVRSTAFPEGTYPGQLRRH